MNQLKFLPGCAVFFAACMLSCNSSSPEKKESLSPGPLLTKAEPPSARPVHWSYTKEGGPAAWGALSPAYALCNSGKFQSPVNLLTDAGKGSSEWKVDYKKTALHIAHNENVQELINNGHTIQVTPEEGSSITYGGKLYQLKQFHFHTPSEHTINGQHFPMEIHLVHESDDKSLAVIGVLVKEGAHNGNFDQLIKYLPNAAGEKKTYDSISIEIGINVPKEMDAWHYVGSLTTPPCSENVQWLVMKNPISMSKEQVDAFSSRLHHNNRPTQQMNKRTLTVDHGTSEN
jgi:carbonic anhydrase